MATEATKRWMADNEEVWLRKYFEQELELPLWRVALDMLLLR